MDYRPLDFPAFEFRLLTLLPFENTNAPIHCLLSYEALLEPPEYRALSYCWGDQDVMEEIFMNGRFVPVGVNLKSALKELQAQGLLVLWVDALCINQNDLLERGLQVMRMGLIYSRAVEVVVWLGGEANDSAMVMSKAGGSSRKALVPEPNHDEGVDITPKSGCLPRTPMDALIALFQRPYWKRVWIIQEVSKARSLLVVCGTYSIPFDHLLSYLKAITFYPPEARSLLAFRNNELKVLRDGQTTRPRLISNLKHSTHSLASDDRDKIYALLGLSADGADIVPTPNYRQPSTRVYFDVFKAILLQNFQFAHLCQNATTTMGTDLVPHWTDITSGLPLFLVNLLTEEKVYGHGLYMDSLPWKKLDSLNSFEVNPRSYISISFSGLRAPIHFMDTLTGVATRFGISSSYHPGFQKCIPSLQCELEQDSGMGREFLLALWCVMKGALLKSRWRSVRKVTRAERWITQLSGSYINSESGPGRTDVVVPSLGHLCLLSKWKLRTNSNSARDFFWNWLFDNQNLVYKQKTIRYWIEAYGSSEEYLNFAKHLEHDHASLLQRLFPRVHTALSQYRLCESWFLEAIQDAINEDLRLTIGSNTMELMPNEVREGDAICRIRYAMTRIVLRPEMDGYRFVVALQPNYSFTEYLGRWNGWPKGVKRDLPKRKILNKWSSEIVLGFHMYSMRDEPYEPPPHTDDVEEKWQSINIC